MWMNSIDVEDAVRRLRGVEAYYDAAVFLNRFMRLIDSISDGWAHWSYGTKCSSDLQQLISDGQWPARRLPPGTARAKLCVARKQVITFLRRCRQTKDKSEVLQFLRDNAGVWRAPTEQA